MNIQQGILEFFEAWCPLSKWYVSVSKKLGQSLPAKYFSHEKKMGLKEDFMQEHLLERRIFPLQ